VAPQCALTALSGEQLGLRFFSHVGEASTQTFAT